MNETLFWLLMNTLLIAILWVPYTLEHIFRVGLFNAMGYSSNSHKAGFGQPSETPTPWAARSYAAHINGVENLVLLVPIALIAFVLNIPVTLPLQVYLGSRLVFTLCYWFKVPVIRTLAFFVGVFAQFYMAWLILQLIMSPQA